MIFVGISATLLIEAPTRVASVVTQECDTPLVPEVIAMSVIGVTGPALYVAQH